MADTRKLIDNNLEAFERYEDASRRSAEARAAILAGLQNQAPLEELLLTATDCIAILCDNQFFADQVRTKLEVREA